MRDSAPPNVLISPDGAIAVARSVVTSLCAAASTRDGRVGSLAVERPPVGGDFARLDLQRAFHALFLTVGLQTLEQRAGHRDAVAVAGGRRRRRRRLDAEADDDGKRRRGAAAFDRLFRLAFGRRRPASRPDDRNAVEKPADAGGAGDEFLRRQSRRRQGNEAQAGRTELRRERRVAAVCTQSAATPRRPGSPEFTSSDCAAPRSGSRGSARRWRA